MTCWIQRWKISRALDSGDLSRLPQRHIDHCADCREFYQRSLLLAERLRQDALWLEAPPPVPSAMAPRSPGRPAARTARPAGRRVILLRVVQAAAAVLALAALLAAFRPKPKPNENIANVPPVVAPLAGLTPTHVMSATAAQPLGQINHLVEMTSQPILAEIDTTRREMQAAGRALLGSLPFNLGRRIAPPPATTRPARGARG